LIGYKLKLVNSLIKNKNIEELEYMEYIFNKITLATKYEKYKHISNIGLGEFWGDYLFIYYYYYYYYCGECYWYTSIESKNI
jgi:hypothetical protein